jgi:hypothetical protein
MKSFIVVKTSNGRWGKGETIVAAMKNAKLKRLPEKDVKVVVQTAVFDRETTAAELDQLSTFWGVDGYGATTRVDDLTTEDKALIERRFIGWLTDDGFCN